MNNLQQLILNGAQNPEERRRLARQLSKIGSKDDDIVIRPPWGANDSIWAAETHKVLQRHYGGFEWLVGLWSDQGVIIIRCADVPTQWQVIIKMDDVDYPALNIVKRKAGEFLERLGLAARRIDHAAVADLPTVATRAKIDLTGVPQSNFGAVEAPAKPRLNSEINKMLQDVGLAA